MTASQPRLLPMALDRLQGFLADKPNLGGRVFALFNAEVAPGINVAAASLQGESGISQAQARLAIEELVKQAKSRGETYTVGAAFPEPDLLALLDSVISRQSGKDDPLANLRVWLQKRRPATHVRIMIVDPPGITTHVFDSDAQALV